MTNILQKNPIQKILYHIDLKYFEEDISVLNPPACSGWNDVSISANNDEVNQPSAPLQVKLAGQIMRLHWTLLSSRHCHV